jgi:RNA polymerase sigma factor (sigma-70 family)
MTPPRAEETLETPEELAAALRESYQRLGSLLEANRGYLLRIIGEEIDPALKARHGTSDIVQTSLLRVLEHFQQATEGLFAVGSEEDLRRWLRRVTLNVLYRESRDERRGVRDLRKDEPIRDGVDHADAAPTPSSICIRKERDERLIEAVNALPEADRLLLRLRDQHDWTYIELAELLEGEPSEAGRVRMQRRVNRIRFGLGDDETLRDLS